MTLFPDTDLFQTQSPKKKHLHLPDAEVMLFKGFIPQEQSNNYYETLLHTTPWREYQMEIYDKLRTVPRMIAWYEDKTNPGADQDGLDWTPELLEIRKRVEVETGQHFNAVLLNLYRNGNDGVSWHSDREGTIGQNPTIASVTFGETRPFRLRHKTMKEVKPVEIPLHHGTLLVMSGTTNTFWQHQIPKTAKQILPRINLTFRQVKRQAAG